MSTASSTLTLALGAGGGLAACYLLRDKIASTTATASSESETKTKSGCSLRLDPSGLTVDGARVTLADAIERCKRAGSANVTILAGAPAATFAELMIALGRAGVPTTMQRNAQRSDPRSRCRGPRCNLPSAPADPWGWIRRRPAPSAPPMTFEGVAENAAPLEQDQDQDWSSDADGFDGLPLWPRNATTDADTSSTFTLTIHPQGHRGPKRVRWFYADPPTTWHDARDRLAAARLIDLRDQSPHLAGAWKLVTDPRVFRIDRAEPLPARTRDAARSATYTLDGRTILRDGEAIIRLERVDLGDERYVLSPHATDVFAKRIVALLNRSRHRQSDRARRPCGGDHAEP